MSLQKDLSTPCGAIKDFNVTQKMMAPSASIGIDAHHFLSFG